MWLAIAAVQLSGTTAGFALRGAQAFDATSLRQTWSVAWLVDSTGAGTGTKFTQVREEPTSLR
jgi:hypothetical protein